MSCSPGIGSSSRPSTTEREAALRSAPKVDTFPETLSQAVVHLSRVHSSEWGFNKLKEVLVELLRMPMDPAPLEVGGEEARVGSAAIDDDQRSGKEKVLD